MKYLFVLVFLSSLLSESYGQYSLQPAYPKLAAFSSPLEMQSAPDGKNNIYVVQQKGVIYVFKNDSTVGNRKAFIDLSGKVSQSGGETGLLGLAFHPNFKTNGYFYVNYTASPGGQLTSFISRFQVSTVNPDTVLIGSELVLLTISQPFSNHNGGHLAFGPDGYLYASFGDGGAGGDPFGNGQNKTVFLGKILRIDVDHEANGNNYSIPADNPFASNTQGFKKEIFCYGVRNTWKFSFDQTTGKLWAGEVGQDIYEEIDIFTNGGNFGWNVMEAYHRYNNSTTDTTQMILPIWEYQHSNGNVSITGGYVYRGSKIPSLFGKYIYGDYGTGRVWALSYDGIHPATNELLVDKASSTLLLSSFGEDQNKEVYFVSYGNGKIYKITSSEVVDNNPPRFFNHSYAGLDTVDVMDNRSTDLGLKSFTWSGVDGTDTSMFSVTLDKPIRGCNTDTNIHHVIIKQKDLVISGCIALAFTDCAGHQSFDTLCFGGHSFVIIQDPLDFGSLKIGDSTDASFVVQSKPNDGFYYNVDSIFFLPSTAASVFSIVAPTPVFPISVGFHNIFIRYKPKTVGGDIVTIAMHTKGTVDSLHYIRAFGRGVATGLVKSENFGGFGISVSPNPFNTNLQLNYSVPSTGFTKLVLMDMLGREAAKIFEGTQERGMHSIDFEGSKIPTGNYILRLESHGKVISRKIIKE